MTKRRTARLYRAYMAIVGAAAAVAVVGGIFAVWATENTSAAPTVAPTQRRRAEHLGHRSRRPGPAHDARHLDRDGSDHVLVPLVPLRRAGRAGRVRLSSDHECSGQHVRPAGSRRRLPHQVAGRRTERRRLGTRDVQSDQHRDLGTSDEHEGADDLRHRGGRKPSPGEPR